MRVKRHSLQVFSSQNAGYNGAAGPIVGDIFDTELREPEQYVVSRSVQPRRPSRLESKSESGDYVVAAYGPPKHQVGRFDTTGLGEYERVLLSCLAWGKYSTYVLVGEMGSGKTTTAKYIAGVLQRPRSAPCGNCTATLCEPIILYIDFNALVHGAILHRFRTKLRSSFKAQLRHIFRSAPFLLAEFIAFVRAAENRTAYSYFDDFIQEAVEGDPGWSALSHAQQTLRLFRFIDTFEQSDDVARLELLMLLLGFVQEKHRPDPACLVLILDNLDSVLPSAQFDLLVEILRFQELAKVRTLVPLRRSTFEQLPNHAALSFGIISHLGPHVADVVKTRITATLERWDQLPQLQALEPYHQDALRARLRFLANDLASQNSASEKVLWLAGASLRIGLYMFERILINNVLAFDSDPQTRDEVLRCAIDGTDTVFDNSSRFIANLFVDPETNRLSLICLRILQFVYEFDARPHLRRTRNLLSVLSAVNPGWRTETVRRALNYLLAPKRPLLWVDGKIAYNTGKHVVECDDVLYLTEAGDNYLRRLLFDLQYLQEMLAALEWEEGAGMPAAVNYGSIHARFELLRLFLGAVVQRDLAEARRFVDSRTKVEFIADLRVEFISQKILLRVAESMVAIYRSLPYRSMEALAACRSWLSTVITCANVEEGLGYGRFESVIRGFEFLIKELEHPRTTLIGEH